ncbi:MAG: hypothetical protein ACK5PF_12220, partial [bacterium]
DLHSDSGHKRVWQRIVITHPGSEHDRHAHQILKPGQGVQAGFLRLQRNSATGACCEVSPDDLVVENYIAVFVSSRPIEWYCFWPGGSAFT